ncbi:uncharacterized protein A4U43_C04F18720 [Asparagus officinalis]|uniref:C2 domain-containing protein n=1 Tax=Asparagus officinalis TaxID=4686 RepID=A0A5P1F6S4_ASPOF|nr:uncharacterized protein A4U43_C04F18720 [Asparagus officinalis]
MLLKISLPGLYEKLFPFYLVIIVLFCSGLELKPFGVLEVKLVQAKGLANKDLVGKSDPFVVAYIRPLPDRMKTSKTINNELNPIWNEHFEFIVKVVSTQRLIVKVYDDEGVHLELLYCPFGMENEFTNPFINKKTFSYDFGKTMKSEIDGAETAEIEKTLTQRKKEVIVRGVLSVTIIAAEELPVMDVMGKADPFVVITMKKSGTKNKTRDKLKKIEIATPSSSSTNVREDALSKVLGKDNLGD